MIKFACRCSHAFSVPDDQAGESLQCPSCGLLVDVPTIDDLPGLREDSTYHFNDESPSSTGAKPSVLRTTPNFANRGDTNDRRLSLKEFLKIGTSDDDLLEIKGEVKPGVPKHPKYDPVTGELILPIDVRREPTPPPMLAQPVSLAYEHRKPGVNQPGIFSPFAWMFRLPNLLVCGVVTAMFLGAALSLGIILLILFVIPLVPMIVSHFANVVDETGPTGVDEMPAPLRTANIWDDFIRPLSQVFLAYAIANAPIVLVNLYVTKLPWAVDLGLTIFLNIMIPALLITTITSGAFNNLLPSRVFSVITASGWHYWVVVVMGYLAMAAMAVASFVALVAATHVNHVIFKGPLSGRPPSFGVIPPLAEILAAPFIVFAAMYLLHVYAWQLGLLYRLHHERFNWVWQKHVSDRTDNQAQLHAHRQRMLEQQAARARQAMEARGTRQAKVPVAKPADPWRH